MHIGIAYYLLVLAAIWREGYASVEEHFEVWPYLVDGVLAAEFEHTHKHRQHPRGHSRKIGDASTQRLPGYTVALHLEIGEKGRLLVWHAQQVDHGVAHQTVRQVVVWRMAAAENQCATIEQSALGIVAKVDSHCVGTAGIVYLLEAFPAHGDELAFVGSGARRLCIPAHSAGPQHVGLAMAHSVDVVLELLVGVHRHVGGKILVSAQVSAEDGRVRWCAV